MMENVALSLGSNVGDRGFFISEMENSLNEILSGPLRRSRLMETEPVGVTEQQGWFLNRIVTGFYTGTPQQLLEATQLIERRLGRITKRDLVPRTADIDILLFGSTVVYEANLIIPHPAITLRRFCLEGLNDLIPEQMVCGIDKTIAQLFEQFGPLLQRQSIVFCDA
jgi:2-amino-4-hydroxy-6-hydroxymethyldihydropteridine diphosphokinase